MHHRYLMDSGSNEILRRVVELAAQGKPLPLEFWPPDERNHAIDAADAAKRPPTIACKRFPDDGQGDCMA